MSFPRDHIQQQTSILLRRCLQCQLRSTHPPPTMCLSANVKLGRDEQEHSNRNQPPNENSECSVVACKCNRLSNLVALSAYRLAQIADTSPSAFRIYSSQVTIMVSDVDSIRLRQLRNGPLRRDCGIEIQMRFLAVVFSIADECSGPLFRVRFHRSD